MRGNKFHINKINQNMIERLDNSENLIQGSYHTNNLGPATNYYKILRNQ